MHVTSVLHHVFSVCGLMDTPAAISLWLLVMHRLAHQRIGHPSRLSSLMKRKHCDQISRYHDLAFKLLLIWKEYCKVYVMEEYQISDYS